VLSAMADEGILGGIALSSLVGESDPALEGDTTNVMIVAVTERRTRDEIDRYVAVLGKVLS